MRTRGLVSIAAILVLSIISTTFVLLTLTSKRWSSQSYYYSLGGSPNELDQKSALCIARRSPFYRCGIPRINASNHCLIPNCTFYKPYGSDKTSCRLPIELGIPRDDPVDALGLFGSSQECQQVHYAGNLQIAASVFITLGLLLVLVLTGFAFLGQEHAAKQETAGVASTRGGTSKTIKPWIAVALLFCFSIGAILQVFAQFFGVLGLTLNATPSSNDVQSDQNLSGQDQFTAQSWVVDKALSSYASVAWTSAVLCAIIASVVFKMPQTANMRL